MLTEMENIRKAKTQERNNWSSCIIYERRYKLELKRQLVNSIKLSYKLKNTQDNWIKRSWKLNSENWKIKVKKSLNSRKFHYNPSSINPTSYVKNNWVSTPRWIEYRSSKNSKVLQKKKRKQNARNWKTHVICKYDD